MSCSVTLGATTSINARYDERAGDTGSSAHRVCSWPIWSATGTGAAQSCHAIRTTSHCSRANPPNAAPHPSSAHILGQRRRATRTGRRRAPASPPSPCARRRSCTTPTGTDRPGTSHVTSISNSANPASGGGNATGTSPSVSNGTGRHQRCRCRSRRHPNAAIAGSTACAGRPRTRPNANHSPAATTGSANGGGTNPATASHAAPSAAINGTSIVHANVPNRPARRGSPYR